MGITWYRCFIDIGNKYLDTQVLGVEAAPVHRGKRTTACA